MGVAGPRACRGRPFTSRGAHETRLGDRAQAALGVAWRLAGAEIDHHGKHHDDADPGGAALDAVITVNGGWEGRQNDSGVVDRKSGGKALFLSPGPRLSAAGWSFALCGSVPLEQDIALSHSPTRWRARFAVARTLWQRCRGGRERSGPPLAAAAGLR